MRALSSLCILAALSCLAACSSVDRETNSRLKTPASSLTKEQAIEEAKAFVARDPASRHYVTVAPTGSMLPIVGSNCIVMLERVRGRVAVGEVVVRADAVMHTVTAVNERGAFIMSGANGQVPDGWNPPEAAHWRMVGVFYARR